LIIYATHTASSDRTRQQFLCLDGFAGKSQVRIAGQLFDNGRGIAAGERETRDIFDERDLPESDGNSEMSNGNLTDRFGSAALR
jgi:hypothetical protein